MGEARQKRLTATKERARARFGRLGALAFVALLALAAVPGLRHFPHAAALLAADNGGQAGPANARATPVGGELLARKGSASSLRQGRLLAPRTGAPGGQPLLAVATFDLQPLRTEFRGAAPGRTAADLRRSRPYDPRGPPAA